MRRIGILGGTFDPFHRGHLNLIRAAHKQLKLHHLYVVPTYKTPLRGSFARVSTRHRLAMIRLGIKSLKSTRLDLYEVKRKSVSYTVNTLNYFSKRFHRNTRFFLIAGSDVVPNLHRWKNIKRILKLATLVVTPRSGFGRAKSRIPFISLRMKPCRVSSTDIQRKLQNHQKPKGLLPGYILRYIRSHGLYLHA
jgi:nicotinate-nucleotide adenylyltransferase